MRVQDSPLPPIPNLDFYNPLGIKFSGGFFYVYWILLDLDLKFGLSSKQLIHHISCVMNHELYCIIASIMNNSLKLFTIVNNYMKVGKNGIMWDTVES